MSESEYREPTIPETKPFQPRVLALVIATSLFMENMDGTVIATALPAISTALREDPLSLKLAFTAYMFSLAIFIPISGWMADRFSARRVFASAIAVFLLGSIACAFASSLEGFIFARVLQGAGGAMMVPVGRLILVRSTPKAQLVQAMTWLTVPALIGPVAGPLLGGFIVSHGDWRWIFLINIPIGLVGIVLAFRLIPDNGTRVRQALDGLGFVLSGVALVSFMMASILAERLGPFSLPTMASLASSALFGWWTIRHFRRVRNPLLNLSLLALPTFRSAILAGSLFRIGVGAIPFLLPLMLQLGFGLDPFQSGLITFVAGLGALVMKTANNVILRRWGFRTVLTVNGTLAAASIAAIGLINPQSSLWLIYPVLFVGGCFRSVQFTSLNALVFAELDAKQMSSATSLASVAQQVSLSLGVTAAASLLDISGVLRGGSSLQPEDFSFAFFGVALVALAAVPLFLRLPLRAGHEISGHATC